MDINCASFESSLPEVYLILPRATYVKEIFWCIYFPLVLQLPTCMGLFHHFFLCPNQPFRPILQPFCLKNAILVTFRQPSRTCAPLPPFVSMLLQVGDTSSPKICNIDTWGEGGDRDMEVMSVKVAFLNRALSYDFKQF